MGVTGILLLGLLLFQNGSHLLEPKRDQRLLRRASLQASLFRSQGDFEGAVAALLQALSISRQNKLDFYQRKCLVRLAILDWDIGNIAESLGYFNEALLSFKQVGDRRSEEFCLKCITLIRLYNQGKEDRKAKLYQRSVERFQRAIFLGREVGFPNFELKCLRQQALTFWDMQRLDLFLGNNKKGLDISAKINNKIEKGRCLNNIGLYYQKQNDYSIAVSYFENALSVIKNIDNQQIEAECLSNLGILYRELGNIRRAHFYLTSALRLDKLRGDFYSVSIDLNNIGTIFLRRGIDNQNRQDLFEALDTFHNCLSLQSKGKADPYIRFAALNNIGIIYNELKNYEKARGYFGLAMKIIESEKCVFEKCSALINIGSSFLYENKIKDACAEYLLSYELGSKNSLDNIVMVSCLGLGRCFEIKHEYSTALSFYQRAIEAMENIQYQVSPEPFMMGFMRNKLTGYLRAIKIIADQQAAQPSQARLEQIFNLVERARARAFLESIRDNPVGSADATSSSARERQLVISKDISELSRMLAINTLSAEKNILLNSELERDEEEFIRLFSNIKAKGRNDKEAPQNKFCSILNVQCDIIDKCTILLEYFLGDNESYLIFISSKNAKLYGLAGRTEIERSLRAYLKMISDGYADVKGGIEASERIGRELIPFEVNEELKNAKAVIIIPDGILHYLPFETLRVNGEHGYRYLVENLTISYCPSASSLYALKNNKSPRVWKKEMLAIGGPRYKQRNERADEPGFNKKNAFKKMLFDRGFRFDQLPHSKKEIMNITKLFKKDKIEILVGDAASEEYIKKLALKEFKIIHFACHGFLDEKYPYRSALVLSLNNQQEDDGFLQMREIYGLSMNADLVVLSACQTGHGILERAEGPMGLVRSFFIAGARSVVASLWPINDKASVIFMQEFYRHLVGGHGAGEALRLAKARMLISPWKHPFYWASFVLHGDSSAVHAIN